MKQTKPAFEKIIPNLGSSVLVRQYADKCRNKLPFWHFHPEIELVYINGGSGKRYIGSHVSYYNDGDLTFIGSNLPHYGFTDRLTGNKSETIVQMKGDFLGEVFLNLPEMENIANLMERAKMGISFHGDTKDKIGAELESLKELNHFDRLMKLISILQKLALSNEYTILNVEGFALEISQQDNDRIKTIFKYVRENFKRPISLDEITDKVSMTEPSFCRYFKKITGKTFTSFVNEYRIVHATKLLAEQPLSITEVCYESGFNNFSHFNKLFKSFMGKNPSKYRNELKHIVQ